MSVNYLKLLQAGAVLLQGVMAEQQIQHNTTLSLEEKTGQIAALALSDLTPLVEALGVPASMLSIVEAPEAEKLIEEVLGSLAQLVATLAPKVA